MILCSACGKKDTNIKETENEQKQITENDDKEENSPKINDDKQENEDSKKTNNDETEKNNLETTVEVESTPKLDNSETIQEISYTQADEVEKQ